MMKKNRRYAAASLALPIVLMAGACGKAAEPTTDTTQGVTSTSTTTSAATTPAPAGGYTDKASFIAALKAAAKDATTAHVSMTMGGATAGQSLTMEGDTRIDPANPAMRMTMDMGSAMKLEMLMVDKKIYMKGFPGLEAGKWAVLDSTSAVGKQMADSLKQADPSKMYDEFDKAVTDVKLLGEDTIDGDATHKYELTLDTTAMDSMKSTTGAKIPDTITYNVWLDDKDHLRRITFDLMGVTADMSMSKYGEPVDITAPPASQTVKAPM